MRAVILAAGMGRRLASMGWGRPKCLLPIGGRSLLDNIITSLLENEIRHVVTVVGYQRDSVEAAAREHPIRCDFVVNEDFANTNTIHSLWLARDYLDDDFLYFNADVYFDRRIVRLLLEHETSALAVEAKPCGEEEVKVVVGADQRIRRIGKALPPEESLGEFIGVARFARSAGLLLVEALRHYVEDRRRRDLFFESAVDYILERHVFTAVPIGGLRAVEIDTPQDYDAAKCLPVPPAEE